MTELTVPARPEEDASPRPVPWRRMAWVTWRQHRLTLAGVAVFLGAWAVYLWIAGLQAYRAYAAATGCRPASSVACGEFFSQFNYSYGDPALHTAVLLQVVPALIGAFAGAPVLARELETGTFRYTWTLAFGRRRWTLAKLVLLAIALAAAAGVFSLLFSWYYQPFFTGGNETPFAPEVFDLRGVGFVAWTLAAFAIAAFYGALIRRTLPAMAATLATWTTLAIGTAVWLRQHYQVPLKTTGNPPAGAWVLGNYATGPNGQVLSQRTLNQLFQQAPASVQNSPNPNALSNWLAQQHYTQWASYEPASRFWHFQLIEGGWLLALSVVLIAASVWLVRRRAA